MLTPRFPEPTYFYQTIKSLILIDYSKSTTVEEPDNSIKFQTVVNTMINGSTGNCLWSYFCFYYIWGPFWYCYLFYYCFVGNFLCSSLGQVFIAKATSKTPKRNKNSKHIKQQSQSKSKEPLFCESVLKVEN